MKVRGLKGTIFLYRGLWYYNIRHNRERLRFPLGTRDKADAIVLARGKEATVLKGLTTTNIDLFDFLDKYQKHSATRKAEKTLNNEKYMIKVIKDLIPDRRLKEVTPKDADQFFDDLAARTRKDHQGNIIPNRISGHGKNLYLRFLRTLWNQAITWKMANENPFKAVKKFSIEAKLPRVLDDKELTKVFESMMKLYPNLADIILFLLFTGMRRNEAITLQWSNVDLEKGLIHLTHTKGHKERIVPIFTIPREILERRKKGLPSPFADIQSGQNLTRKFGEIIKAARVPHAKLHDLRKTFGTMLASNNVSAFTIMRWMGHSDSNVTLNHYIGMDKEAMKKVEASIRAFGDSNAAGPSLLPN